VEERRVGIASGVNNGISRVAGLLAIAVLGAVISAHFGARLDSNLGELPLSGQARQTVDEAKAQPLAVPGTEDLAAAEASRILTASANASTSAFHLGVLIAGLLMILGGIAAGFGIEDPKRRERLSLVAHRATKVKSGGAGAEETPGSEPA
jgi:hypothetical protein